MAVLIAFELCVGALLVSLDLPTSTIHISRWVSVPVFVVITTVNLVLIARIWHCLGAGWYPLALAVAREYLPLSGWKRWVYALVWSIYAAGAVAACVSMEAAVSRMGWDIAIPGLLIICLGMAFVANLILVLFLTAVTANLQAASVFWRWRHWIDLGIGAALLMATFR